MSELGNPRMLARRRAVLAGLSLASLRAWAVPEGVLPLSTSLAADLTAALARARALVVLASIEACPWCKLVRQSYLASLRREGQPVVEFDMRSGAAIRDFKGDVTTQAQLAQGLRLKAAPTVLFLGRDGREVAPRLVGVPLPDFYGAYLDERVAAANRAVA